MSGMLAALGALALPLGVKLPYFQHLIILALIWVVLAQGQNLIQGFTGYVSIAQAGFMGMSPLPRLVMTLGLAGSLLGVGMAWIALQSIPDRLTKSLGDIPYGLTWSKSFPIATRRFHSCGPA